MFISPSSLALLLTLSQPVAESVPRLNVEPGCRAAARAGQSLDGMFAPGPSARNVLIALASRL
jgi:hypothetical protein